MDEAHNDHLPPPNDADDALLDANLRALGARIGPVPGAATRARLRLAGTHAGTRSSHRPRWLAIGSALAACLAIAGVLLFQPWGSTVHASTIASALRSRQFAGVNIRFDKVASRDGTIDGVLRLRLRTPISMDTLDGERALGGKDQIGAAHGSFTISSAGAGEVRAEMAMSPATGWVYVYAPPAASGAPDIASPAAAVLGTVAAQGVVMNLGGLDDAALDGLSMALLGPGEDAGADSDQMRRLAKLGRSLLSGNARREELEQVKTVLDEDFAQEARVQHLGGGRHMLSAELADPGSGERAGTLRVCYREDVGVEWAELSSMPEASGAIRIDFDPEPIDPALLSYERLVETGKTSYVDLRLILRMLTPSDK